MTRTRRRLAEMEAVLEQIKLILMLKDPGATPAAELFDGLRKQVVAGAQARRQHMAHLAQLDAALHEGARVEDIQALVADLLAQAGVRRLDDPSQLESPDDPLCFETDADSEGPVKVVRPAYVDVQTGSPIRMGRLRGQASSNPAATGSTPGTSESQAPPSDGEDGRRILGEPS